jgi:hypothetical protein
LDATPIAKTLVMSHQTKGYDQSPRNIGRGSGGGVVRLEFLAVHCISSIVYAAFVNGLMLLDHESAWTPAK